MAKTESVLFKLGADVSGLTRGLSQGRRGLEDVGKAADGLTSKLVGLAGVLGVGLGFASAARDALVFADSVVKVSDQTGLSIAAVQRLAFFASQTGNTLEDVTGAIGKMQENLVKAADGSDKQAEAFANLKINTEDFFRLDPEAQFQQVAAAISGIQNPADRAAAAVSVFGKSGKEVIPLMEAMAKQGNAINAQFDAMGGGMSSSAIKALDDIGDGAARTGQAVRNFVGELLAMGGPAIVAAMDGMTQFFGGLRVLMGAGSNEMVNLDDKITALTESITKLENAGGMFADMQKEARLPQMRAELEMLKAQYTELAEAPTKLAAAQIAARKAAAAAGPEELEDLIVHEKKKTVAILDAETERHLLLLQLREENNSAIQLQMQGNEDAITGLTVKGLNEREQFQNMGLAAQADTVFGRLEQMTAGVSQHSKTMFKINKAAALANATVHGYESIVSSFKFGSNIGGPYVGAAFAAVAAAATFAQISAIAKTQYQGGGGGVAPSNATQAPTPTTPAGGGGGGGDRVLKVEGLNPGALFTTDSVRALAGQLLEFQRDGGKVLLS